MWHGYRLPSCSPSLRAGRDMMFMCFVAMVGFTSVEILLPPSTPGVPRRGQQLSPHAGPHQGSLAFKHQRVDEHWSGCFTDLDCIHPRAHVPNRNYSPLSHSGMAPCLQSSLLLFSRLSLLLSILPEKLVLGAHRDCVGVRHQFEEWHKALLLCFCFVTGKDDSMCFFMHTELSEIAPGLAVSGRLMAGSVHNLVCGSGASSLPPLSIT